MYTEIKDIFSQIINKIQYIDKNLYKLIKNPTNYYKQYNFIELYFNTISEIWILNLINLHEIYNEDYNLFSYFNF